MFQEEVAKSMHGFVYVVTVFGEEVYQAYVDTNERQVALDRGRVRFAQALQQALRN